MLSLVVLVGLTVTKSDEEPRFPPELHKAYDRDMVRFGIALIFLAIFIGGARERQDRLSVGDMIEERKDLRLHILHFST